MDILTITETHLDLSIDREHTEIDGYELKRRDSQKSQIMIKYLNYMEELSSITKRT